jgi:hypothetical protein
LTGTDRGGCGDEELVGETRLKNHRCTVVL